MKNSTQNIINWLNSNQLIDQLKQFKQTNPTYSFNETTAEESIQQFELAKSLLIKAIEQNIFDEQITYSRRIQIHNSLKSIVTQLNEIANHKFNAANANAAPLAQTIISGIHNLMDNIENAKIEERLNGFGEYSNEIKELVTIRRHYHSIISDLEKIKSLNEESKTLNKELKIKSESIIEIGNQLESEISKVKKHVEDTEYASNNVKRNNQDIENKKVNITAFFSQVDTYQKSLTNIEADAKTLLSKEKDITNLISQAEKALDLKSAEGISAAFSSHYSNTSSKNTLVSWIFGASLFMAGAIGLTIWIALAVNSAEWSAIISRIVGVAISITAATFCAKQYIKQKNIIEDYAYKSVLAKSIIAFTEEIKKRDEKKVAEFLTKVLDEIYKDPLRTRENHEDKNIGFNTQELIDKLLAFIPKPK